MGFSAKILKHFWIALIDLLAFLKAEIAMPSFLRFILPYLKIQIWYFCYCFVRCDFIFYKIKKLTYLNSLVISMTSFKVSLKSFSKSFLSSLWWVLIFSIMLSIQSCTFGLSIISIFSSYLYIIDNKTICIKMLINLC